MKTVVGMFESRSAAERAILRLKEWGLESHAISIALLHDDDENDGSGPERLDDVNEGATMGLVSGAAVGTLIGLALAGSTFVLPGIGTILVGGPLAAALAGAGLGAASGGVLGALVGVGIPKHEAEHFSAGVEQGNVVVSAHVTDEHAAAVSLILDEEGSLRTHAG